MDDPLLSKAIIVNVLLILLCIYYFSNAPLCLLAYLQGERLKWVCQSGRPLFQPISPTGIINPGIKLPNIIVFVDIANLIILRSRTNNSCTYAHNIHIRHNPSFFRKYLYNLIRKV